MNALMQPLAPMAVELLFRIIFDQYLSESYCLTFISDNKSDINIYSTAFTHVNIDKYEDIIQPILKVSEMGCSDYVILLSDPIVFIKAFDEVNHIATVRRSDRKLIFVIQKENDNEEVLNILSMKEMSYVANVLVIFKNGTSVSSHCQIFSLITHQFIGIAETDKPIYLDEWNSCTKQFKNRVNLFPHDMGNLIGKKLKVAAFTYKPYVLLDLDESISINGRDGTEIRVLSQICRQLNCTIEIVRDDEGQWGEIFDNRTGNGVIGNVVEDRADVGITALYEWYHEFTFLDFSIPYIRTAITCLVPAPRLLPSWELPILPFTWSLWLAVLGTLVLASIALLIAKQGSTDLVFLTTFGMMITQSQPDPGRTWRVRSITGWMLIAALIIDNAYGGGLASTYTVPKFEKSIDSVQALLDSPLEWGATHDAWIFSLILSKEPKIIHLLDKFRVYDGDTLRRKSLTRGMAFSIEMLPAGSFAIGDYIDREAAAELQLMHEEFYWEQCVIMTRKSSPYTAKLNEYIGRLHESGLILAWETQVALKHLDYKVQLEVRLSRSRRDVAVGPLKLHHVIGIFIMYGIGCMVSLLLFLGELTSRGRKIN